MGPQDPTQNHSMPPEMMALGIPADMAARMVKNLDASFVTRRPQVAFPNHERGLNRKVASQFLTTSPVSSRYLHRHCPSLPAA
jgi:hypothetical protein